MLLRLKNGSPLPPIGFGTSTGPLSPEGLEKVLDTALEIGYRHFDTAYIYQNEPILGKTLHKWFNSGKLKREDVFITTKLPLFGIHQDRVEYFLQKSLKNLQLEFVDLYLVHFPVGVKYQEKGWFMRDENGEIEVEGKTDHAAIWKKMEEQLELKHARYIGLSNYNIQQIQKILESHKIKPSCLQIEIHPHLQQPNLVEFCKKNDILVVGYSPLGSRENNARWRKYFPNFEDKPLPDILNDPTIRQIAKKYSKTTAQVALRFLVQMGVVPIPLSTNPERMRENFGVFDFELDVTDVAALRELDVGEKARITTFSNVYRKMGSHPDFPFGLPEGS